MSKPSPIELSITEIQCIMNHEAVAVEIAIENERDFGQKREYISGIAKCTPPDKFDPQLGYELAFWRAVQVATNRHLKRLNGQIKHNDDMRIEKEKAKAKKKIKNKKSKK